MSGLADLLLTRSRGDVAATGSRALASGAVEPRLPGRYEVSSDQLEPFGSEVSSAGGVAYDNQLPGDHPPKALSAGLTLDAVQSDGARLRDSAQSAADHELRHAVRVREVRHIVVERDGAARTDLSPERPLEPRGISAKGGQAADPFQTHAQGAAAPELREGASALSRIELRKSDSESPIRAIEPKVNGIDTTLKAALDSARSQTTEQVVRSRFDAEPATNAGRPRTRRERSQQEGTAKSVAPADPVIEIHIGRIEIRAAGPQPAPLRRAPRQPISLEEYGRLRKGEGR